MPKVNIIMSVFNQEPYIMDSVNSIIGQSFKDWNLIIVNDGSIDKSLALLETFTDPRIKIINNVENKGLIFSLNSMLAISSDAEYIARMDSDDIAFPTRLEKQLNFMLNHPQTDILGTAIKIFGNEIKSKIRYVPQSNTKITESLFCFNPIMHPTLFFRSYLLDKGFSYDENYKGYEDYALWAKLADNFIFNNLDEPLLWYRRHSNNVTAGYKLDIEKDKSIFIEIIKCLSKNLNIKLSTNSLDILAIITSRERSVINRNIPIGGLMDMINEFEDNFTRNRKNFDYLNLLIHNRVFIYLLITNRVNDILRFKLKQLKKFSITEIIRFNINQKRNYS
ncbi:glycosyltransferase [Pedobacter sp. 22163]|uniref:glycosyltransferase n=1 Tax=Pedobacter sp. 22163 TaxID=3453883 RepID=UPI003F87B32A